jgi:hypothetical protein
MASIVKEALIERKVDDVWDAVRDFGGLQERLATGFVQNCRLESDTIRMVTLTNGAQLREVLVGVDDNARRLSYTVVESPLPFAQHSASVQVLTADGDGSRFVWITDFLPDEVAGTVDDLMQQGIEAIKTTLEKA